MRYVFTLILILSVWFGAFCKMLPLTDSVTICGRKFEIPLDMTLTNNQQLNGPGYSFSWQYISDKKQERLTKNIIGDLNKANKNLKQTDLYCYFLYTTCKAYEFTLDNGTGQIIVSATVNKQPVYVQITLSKPGFTNEQLPSFITKLITLSR